MKAQSHSWESSIGKRQMIHKDIHINVNEYGDSLDTFGGILGSIKTDL